MEQNYYLREDEWISNSSSSIVKDNNLMSKIFVLGPHRSQFLFFIFYFLFLKECRLF